MGVTQEAGRRGPSPSTSPWPSTAKTWIDQRNVKPRTRIGYQALFDNHIQGRAGQGAAGPPHQRVHPELVRPPWDQI